MRNLIIITLLFISVGCDIDHETPNESGQGLENGLWRAVLHLEKGDLPFNFNFNTTYIEFINDIERLQIKDIRFSNDSIFIPGYIFQSEIQAKIDGNNHLVGKFIKFDTKEKYEIPFEAWSNSNYRFSETPERSTFDITGKWEVTFDHEGEISKAIGNFDQEGNKVTGTFLTPTGDYRFLEGEASGNEISLSTFDGSHAFLFTATQNNGTLTGHFYSGIHWHETWVAVKNDGFTLPDPDSLTFLNDGYDKIEFTFPNVENGEMISSSDSRFENKVTILQVMGSWCPNCMDETKFLTELKAQFPEVEIIGLAFEKFADYNKAAKRIQILKEKLNVNYDFVIAGTHSKESTAKALPMLNKIMSYPTAILIDKQGKVRNIHTGFSGPGTGEHYSNFKANYTLKVKNLLNE